VLIYISRLRLIQFSNLGLLSYDYIITGFISNDAFLAGVSDLLQRARSLNPRLRYVCDPVLGDDGKSYCPPELVERFKLQLLPQSFIITPNAFEAQLLTGTLHVHSTTK
jgi:pyridoxine kinase